MPRKVRRSPYRRLSEDNERALFVQVNADIESAAQEAARSLMDGSTPSKISYPPNHGFTEEELKALEALQTIPNVEAALRKVIADAASRPLFRLLTYIDGVSDPSGDAWDGVYLTELPDEGDEAELEDTWYHDLLFARYWDWRRIRPTREWQLDALDQE